MPQSRVIFRIHAIQRMFERKITESDVRHVIETGEIIEDYPSDLPYPSRLILGWQGNRPIHIVIARNEEAQEIIVITVYEPDTNQWSENFRRRMK
ncbi:MAG: DUF4258 domain-containing protein [Chloroflexota bacterium]